MDPNQYAINEQPNLPIAVSNPAANIQSMCPEGLDYLMHIDQFLIKQKAEIAEAITGFETSNRYKVVNSMGQPMYSLTEKSDCCTRNICGKYRPFVMSVYDNARREVMCFKRPLRCNAQCLPFGCLCGQLLEVESPPGHVIARIRQKFSCCAPRFVIEDGQTEQPVLRVNGPFCVIDCLCAMNFKLLPMNNDTEIGVVTKTFSGVVKEAFTDADNFAVMFPLDLDVKIKAAMIGMGILIDFMYFENNSH